jgi:hypothetical protein
MKKQEQSPAAVCDRRRSLIPRNFRRSKTAATTTLCAIFAFFCGHAICSGQVHQAWVAKYNNGITAGMHQAVKMAMNTNGNIYVTGFSQNTNGNTGYATLKYSSVGNQLWAARYDTTNGSSVQPVGLVLDGSNNVIVTGTGLTVKYDTHGNQLWTAPYAGTALAVDTSNNVFVTGFGTNYNTVKLSPAGSNLWTQTYVNAGVPSYSQAVLVDGGGNIYLSGNDTFGVQEGQRYAEITTVKYDANGNELWVSPTDGDGAFGAIQVARGAFDNASNLYLAFAATGGGGPQGYSALKYSPGGTKLWMWSDTSDGLNDVRDLVLDSNRNILLTGKIPTSYTYFG